MSRRHRGKPESLRGSSAWTLAGTLSQGGYRFLLNVLIGRFGGPALLGQTSGILALAQLATLLGATSLSATLTRYLATSAQVDSAVSAAAVTRHLRRRMLQWLVLIAIVASGLAGATGVLQADEAIMCFVIASSLAGYQFAKAYLLGTGRVRRASTLEVFTAVGGISLAIGLLWVGVRDENLLWPVAATAVTFSFASGLARGEGRPTPELTRELDRFVLLGVAGTLVSAGFLQGSMILASLALSGAEAGEYASAFTLATPLSLLTMSVGLVLFPAFARTSQESNSFATLLERAVSGMAVLVVPLFSVIMLLSSEVITVVWSHELRYAGTILTMLVCAVMFGGLGMPASQALTSTGVRGMATSVKIGAGGLIAGLLVWAVAVPALGAQGIALGFLAGTVITSATPLVIMGRRVRVSWIPAFVRGWGAGLAVTAMSVMAAHSEVGVATRSGLAVLVVAGWLFFARRHVMVLLRP